ncbi:hypothetical protein KM043_004485 [Ampulex compressa]|nr:hypothetical protein KM043_004485 [Ampulex compressa]
MSLQDAFMEILQFENFYDQFKMEDGDNKVDVELGKEKKSYAGIPEADFVDDVDAFMAKPENESVDKVLQTFDENHGKYKFMEYNLVNKRRRLKAQIPDLERSLEMIKKLQVEKNNSQDLETQFLLSELLYAKAIIPPTDKVCLWLGANVMLEYTLDDAQEMLTKNIEAAKRNLGYVVHDLDFVRDQFTTTEINLHEAHLFLFNFIHTQNSPKTQKVTYTNNNKVYE